VSAPVAPAWIDHDRLETLIKAYQEAREQYRAVFQERIVKEMNLQRARLAYEEILDDLRGAVDDLRAAERALVQYGKED
jgi:hypothetical protein